MYVAWFLGAFCPCVQRLWAKTCQPAQRTMFKVVVDGVSWAFDPSWSQFNQNGVPIVLMMLLYEVRGGPGFHMMAGWAGGGGGGGQAGTCGQALNLYVYIYMLEGMPQMWVLQWGVPYIYMHMDVVLNSSSGSPALVLSCARPCAVLRAWGFGRFSSLACSVIIKWSTD